MVDDSVNEAGLREIPASEILNKIQKGEIIEYDHVIVRGDLDIKKLNLTFENGKYLVNSKIKINNSQITGVFLFEHTIFDRTISFDSTQFNGDVYFRGAQFNEEAHFNDANFSKNVYFSGSQFKGDANFFQSQLKGDAYLNGVTFCGDAIFRGSLFKRIADFQESHFNKDAYFRGAQFEGRVYFREAQFKGDAKFTRSRIDNIADFNAIFSNNLAFDGSRIYSMILSEAVFERNVTISLKSSDFVRLEVRWDPIRDKIIYDDITYLFLVKNFNYLGQFDDADDCYYKYRTDKRKMHLKGIIPKLFDYIAWIAYGYGVRPSNPLILSFGLFIISVVIFISGFGLQELPGSIMNAMYLSVLVLTSSPKTDPLTGLYNVWGMIERITGWLLMSCFLVVLAKRTLR
ncbi:MAG: hypothetical protein A4E49_02024 [Methanosaeta sp. PtaU1.Bin112]|nr:MAG: hypothetical protein A4E49_02024 [Methanosaeta sp. PtaU1.Bin112]